MRRVIWAATQQTLERLASYTWAHPARVSIPKSHAPHRPGARAQVTDQKVAMEVLLARLGVTAKTNFLHVKGLFDSMDADGSGAVDGEELTRAPLCTPWPTWRRLRVSDHAVAILHVETWIQRWKNPANVVL